MAQFRVGQRVKRVAGGFYVRVGAQGVVMEINGDGFVAVLYDSPDNPIHGAGPKGSWYSLPANIAPLLPPDEAADAFIARIRKLGSEPVNDAPKVTVREGK